MTILNENIFRNIGSLYKQDIRYRGTMVIIVVLFLLQMTNNGFGQADFDDEIPSGIIDDFDNEIIAGLIKDYFKHKPNDTVFNRKGEIKKIFQFHDPDIVLVNETAADFLADLDIKSLRQYQKNGLKSLDFKMYSDYIVKNKTVSIIDSIKGYGGIITYISQSDLKEVFDNGWWENYYNTFGYKVLVSISRPALNSKGDKAYLHFSCSTGGLSGTGYYIVMEKVNEKWVIKETILVWIS